MEVGLLKNANKIFSSYQGIRFKIDSAVAYLIGDILNECRERFFNEDKKDGKKEIEFKLSKVQHEKNLAKAKNKSFEYGEALLQIAIILVSTSIISAIGGLLLGGVLIGGFGIAAVLNGFFLFFTIST